MKKVLRRTEASGLAMTARWRQMDTYTPTKIIPHNIKKIPVKVHPHWDWFLDHGSNYIRHESCPANLKEIFDYMVYRLTYHKTRFS